MAQLRGRTQKDEDEQLALTARRCPQCSDGPARISGGAEAHKVCKLAGPPSRGPHALIMWQVFTN